MDKTTALATQILAGVGGEGNILKLENCMTRVRVEVSDEQRLDLAEHKSLWLEKTERIDRGWQTVFGLRRYLVLGSSVMALYGIRHPSKMIRWSRRAFGDWSAIRLFKKTFSAK